MQGKSVEAARLQAELDNDTVERQRLILEAKKGIAGAQETLNNLQIQSASVVKNLELDSLQRIVEAKAAMSSLNGEHAKSRILQMQLLAIEIERAELQGASPAELASLQRAREEIEKMLTPLGALKKGWSDVAIEWTDSAEMMRATAEETAMSMHDAFSDFFFDVMTGELDSFGDYVRMFLQSVARAMANTLASQSSNWISTGLQVLGSFAGGYGAGGGAMAAATSSNLAAGTATPAILNAYSVMHTGYAPGDSAETRMLPRYHSGIGPGEKKAIIRDDEGVFTQGQMRALGLKANSGGGGNTTYQIDAPITIESGAGGSDKDKEDLGNKIAKSLRREIISIIAEQASRDTGVLFNGGR
jgi:hypothetical protein